MYTKKQVLAQKTFSIVVNRGLSEGQTPVYHNESEAVHGVPSQGLTGKKKILEAGVSTEGQADRVLEHERTLDY